MCQTNGSLEWVKSRKQTRVILGERLNAIAFFEQILAAK
jgi:hypothetical protein